MLGASRYPLRRSFYTWAEGVGPTVVFEFLSDATESEDRNEKVAVYLRDIGVSEYFIHQPDNAAAACSRSSPFRLPSTLAEKPS